MRRTIGSPAPAASARVASTPGSPAPRGPGTLTDLAVRQVVATLSTDDLVAVADGHARLELHPVGPARPDPAQLGLYTEPIPVVPASVAGQSPPARSRRAPAAPVPARDHGVDVAAAVARINELPTPAAVDTYLRDPGFSLAALKLVARALGPTVLGTGRSKAAVRRDIVAGTVGFRSRSAAMSGGAWA